MPEWAAPVRVKYMRTEGQANHSRCAFLCLAFGRDRERGAKRRARHSRDRAGGIGATMQEFDYTAARWKRKAESIKRRDGYMCVRCKRYGRTTPAKIVHHIKHVDEYPELAYTSSNLESLCIACHNAMHPEKGRQAGRYEKRWDG